MTNKAPMDQYGSSDLALWHFFTVFTGVTLMLIPLIGSFMAIVALLGLGIPTAMYVAKRDHRNYYDTFLKNQEYMLWVEDLDNRFMNLSMPTLSTNRSIPEVNTAKLHNQAKSFPIT